MEKRIRKKATEQDILYRKAYNKANYNRYEIKVRKDDLELIAKIAELKASEDGFGGYVRKMIRKEFDIKE